MVLVYRCYNTYGDVFGGWFMALLERHDMQFHLQHPCPSAPNLGAVFRQIAEAAISLMSRAET